MSHTPGPWTDISDKPKCKGKWPPMAMVKAGGRSAIDCTDSGDSPSQDRANARLIAAAPDLLAALKLYVEKFEQDFGVKSAELALPEAIAAIAKAEGK